MFVGGRYKGKTDKGVILGSPLLRPIRDKG